jgi:hypothetical protein
MLIATMAFVACEKYDDTEIVTRMANIEKVYQKYIDDVTVDIGSINDDVDTLYLLVGELKATIQEGNLDKINRKIIDLELAINASDTKAYKAHQRIDVLVDSLKELNIPALIERTNELEYNIITLFQLFSENINIATILDYYDESGSFLIMYDDINPSEGKGYITAQYKITGGSLKAKNLVNGFSGKYITFKGVVNKLKEAKIQTRTIIYDVLKVINVTAISDDIIEVEYVMDMNAEMQESGTKNRKWQIALEVSFGSNSKKTSDFQNIQIIFPQKREELVEQ